MKSNSMLFVLSLLACCVARADSDKKVTVSGQCTNEVSPDRGSIVFVVENTTKDVKDAIQKTTQAHEKLRDELKKLKIKDLELSTSEYTVFEKKEWEKDKSVSKGFSARLGVRATTPEISKIGDLIATAAKLGIKETNSLNLHLSEQKLLDEKKKCLDVAAKNAREKADALAKSMNVRIGKVLQIIERGSGSISAPQPMYETRMMAKGMNDSSPTIEGQKQTLTQDVEVSFAIE